MTRTAFVPPEGALPLLLTDFQQLLRGFLDAPAALRCHLAPKEIGIAAARKFPRWQAAHREGGADSPAFAFLLTQRCHGQRSVPSIATDCRSAEKMLRERVKADMAQARRAGKRIGRPALRHFSPLELERIRALRTQGASVRKLAKDLGTTQWTIAKITAAIAAA